MDLEMGRLHLVSGGSGSGKSEYAEGMALALGSEALFYLATMRIWDEEGRRRVKRHRRMREGKGFVTVERYTDLGSLALPALSKPGEKSCLLLECLSNLAANEFYEREEGAAERILNGIKALQKQCGDIIIVTNEIFSDGIEYSPETERYRRLLGRLNGKLGEEAASVTEVVFGIPLCLKGKVPEKRGPHRDGPAADERKEWRKK